MAIDKKGRKRQSRIVEWTQSAGDHTEVRSGGASPESDNGPLKNYRPPLRLVVFEVTALILLICLIIPEPLGISAIGGTGDTTIGLLRGCSGTCSSWLGAGAGGAASSSASAGSTDTADSSDSALSGLTSRTLLRRAPADSGGDNTSFFLRTGLATVCSFYLLLYSLIFHLLRLWGSPPPENGDDEFDAQAKKESRKGGLWMCCCCFAGVNFNWVKPFGYRVSRVFTATNVLLLLVISIDAGRVAGVGGVATGFYLLIITTLLMIYIALLEFLDSEGKISGWLMVGHAFKERTKCWGKREEDSDESERALEEGRGGRRVASRARTESTAPMPSRFGKANGA